MASDQDSPGESRSLLSDEPATAESYPAFPDAPASPTTPPPMRALLVLLLLTSLAASLYQLPVNRVIERRLCLEHYRTHDPARIGPGGAVDEAACKVDAVQRGLAQLQGIMETAWVVGDFAVALPLGLVAERGRRPAVLLLNLLPRLALPAWALAVLWADTALPTRAVVAASFLSVLGGDCVLGSLTYSLAAGLTADPVQRAAFFGYMGSVAYVVALVGPALASATMSLALSLPLALSVGLAALAVPVIRRLPLSPGASCDPKPSASSPLAALVRSRPRSFGLLLVSFLLTALASSDTKLLTQYISKRYAWTFAQAGYLLSCKAVVNVVLLTVVVPRVLRRRPGARDGSAASLFFARLCLGVSVVGAAAIALAATVALLVPSLLVYALGSVLPVFTYSLLKSPAVLSETGVEEASDTHIFAVVMLAKTLGSLIGAPLMASVWVWGIGLGGMALGLPYFVSSTCYLAALGVFAGIRA